MNIAMITVRQCYPTARRIRDALRDLGHQVLLTKKPRSKLERITRADALLRWGSSHAPWLDELFQHSGRHVLNEAEEIQKLCDKFSMLNAFAASDLRTGTFGRVSSGVGPGLIVLSRWTSGGGRGILEPSEYNRATNNPYSYVYTQARMFTHEMRCIVSRGLSYRLGVKINSDPDKNRIISTTNGPINIRSARNGWTIVPLTNDRANELGINRNAARDMGKSMAACFPGMALIACDFGVDQEGYFFPIEANSAPGLNDAGVQTIITPITDILQEDTRIWVDQNGERVTPEFISYHPGEFTATEGTFNVDLDF